MIILYYKNINFIQYILFKKFTNFFYNLFNIF